MLTSFDDEGALLDASMAGASGYALKQSGTDLVSAVRTVGSGRSMLDLGVATRLMVPVCAAGPRTRRSSPTPWRSSPIASATS